MLTIFLHPCHLTLNYFSLFSCIFTFYLFIFFRTDFQEKIQQASIQVYESTLRIYLDEFSGQKLKLKKDLCLHDEKIYVEFNYLIFTKIL